MQLYFGWQVLCQLIPYGYRKVFGRCELACHKFNIQVQITVIYLLYDLILYNITQCFSIEDKPCFFIRGAFDSYMQFIVMTMPVVVGTFTEYFLVLFLTPCGIGQFVRSIEIVHTREIDRYFNKIFGKNTSN